jgi:hypothetical protein
MATATYLDRLLEPVTTAFTPQFAKQLLALEADPDLQAEIAVLREKSTEGTLTTAEMEAYRDFVEAVDVISILQSKARRYLSSITRA